MATVPLAAQTVVVRVEDAETSRPLAGAIAYLVDSSGVSIASRLSDESGRVVFGGVDRGRYAVRAVMIGHATGESDGFDVSELGTSPLVLRLETRAIALAGVEVTAQGGRCELRPAGEGRLLAAVWEEARKALSVAEVTHAQGLYRYALTEYDRRLDADGAVVEDTQRRRQGLMRSPFAGLEVEELVEGGFVRRTATEWTYYAPDAQALLSERFLDTHCFRLVEQDARPQLVGLAFEPTSRNRGLPDISGTLWLDRDSVQLRFLEYTYENLEPDVRPGDATGWVRFQRMPVGTWIVPEWWIRMPLVQVDASRSDRSRRIVGYVQTGGRVDEVLDAQVAGLGLGARTGTIVGTVVDSMGAPIEGVRVSTVGSTQEIHTDVEGRFALARLDEGTYRVRFLNPTFDSLGLAPPMLTQQVIAGLTTELAYTLPSAAAVLRASCGAEADPESGALGGIVREAATGAPIPGASVRATWSTLDVRDSGTRLVGRETRSGYETTTDGSGAFRFCSLPVDEALAIHAAVGGVRSDEETLEIPRAGGARAHVILIRTP